MASTHKIVDTTTLRHLVMRAMESEHSLEMENIQLRQQIEHINMNPKVPTNFSTEKLSTIIQNLRHSHTKLKEECKQQIQFQTHDLNTMKEKYTLLSSHFSSYLENQKKVKNNIQNLEQTIQQYKQDIKLLQNDKDKIQYEYTSLSNKYTNITNELQSLQSSYELLSNNYDNAKNESFSLQTKLEQSKAEMKKTKIDLTLKITQLESELQQQLRVKEQYTSQHGYSMEELEQVIKALQMKLEELYTENKTQQDEIERLNGLLMGNKSHFAKYVEIKTENASLLAKVKLYEDVLQQNYEENQLLDKLSTLNRTSLSSLFTSSGGSMKTLKSKVSSTSKVKKHTTSSTPNLHSSSSGYNQDAPVYYDSSSSKKNNTIDTRVKPVVDGSNKNYTWIPDSVERKDRYAVGLPVSSLLKIIKASEILPEARTNNDIINNSNLKLLNNGVHNMSLRRPSTPLVPLPTTTNTTPTTNNASKSTSSSVVQPVFPSTPLQAYLFDDSISQFNTARSASNPTINNTYNTTITNMLHAKGSYDDNINDLTIPSNSSLHSIAKTRSSSSGTTDDNMKPKITQISLSFPNTTTATATTNDNNVTVSYSEVNTNNKSSSPEARVSNVLREKVINNTILKR